MLSRIKRNSREIACVSLDKTTEEFTNLKNINPRENLSLIVSTNIEEGIVREVIKYKVLVRNSGTTELKDINIYSELAASIKFLQGTIKVNNIPLKTGNITSGIEIGDLDRGELKTLSFDAEIIENKNANVIINASFLFLEQDNKIRYKEVKSNISVVEIKEASLYIEKTSDLEEVRLDDIITYSVLIVNNGDLEIRNIIFRDVLDKSTKFIENSFVINGEKISSVDIENGVRVGNLEQIQILEIEYKAKVINTNYNGEIINIATVKYDYKLNNGTWGKRSFDKIQAISAIKSRTSCFKQITIESLLDLPDDRPCIESINEVKGEATVTRCHLIETGKSVSQEGQRITGYKLVVSGYVDIVINYTAYELEQAVYSSKYQVYFTEFVVLSNAFNVGSKIKATAKIEDIYYNLRGGREIYINPTLFLDVKVGKK